MESLTRLKQTSTIANYKTQFESLSNWLRGLSKSHKLSYFLNGLKDEIRFPLHMFNLVSLNAVFRLAKIQEEYLLSTQKGLKFVDDKSVGMPKRWQWSNEGINRVNKPAISTRNISSSQMDEKRKKLIVLPL